MSLHAGYIETKGFADLRRYAATKGWHRTASVIGPSDHVIMISVSQIQLAACALERVEIDVDDVDGSARLAATVCVGHDPTIEVFRGHVFHVHWKMSNEMNGSVFGGFSFGFRLRFSYHKVCTWYVLYCLCLCLIVTLGICSQEMWGRLAQ